MDGKKEDSLVRYRAPLFSAVVAQRSANNSSLSRSLELITKQLERKQKEAENLDNRFVRILDKRSLIKRSIGLVARFIPKIGERFAMASISPLRLHSQHLKDLIIETQAVLTELSRIAFLESEEIAAATRDLERIKSENWSAAELRSFFFEESNLPLSEDVLWISEQQLKSLNDEEVEGKRQWFLRSLSETLEMRHNLIILLGKVAAAGIEVLEKSAVQYSSLQKVIEPMEVLRSAAKGFSDAALSSFLTTDMVQSYLKQATESMELTIEATKLLKNSLVANPEMNDQIRAYVESIEEKLRGLYDSDKLLDGYRSIRKFKLEEFKGNDKPALEAGKEGE